MIVYALPDDHPVETLEVPEDTTVEQALRMSETLRRHPEIDLETQKIGIFAKLVKLDNTLSDGDRIEIYRSIPRKSRDPYSGEKGKKPRSRAKKQAEAAAKENEETVTDEE